jgi:hypothetical protein
VLAVQLLEQAALVQETGCWGRGNYWSPLAGLLPPALRLIQALASQSRRHL